MFRFLISIGLIVLSGTFAQARVFNINNESFAAYFLASGGGSQLGTSAIQGESGTNVTFSGGTNYEYTGEFGFVYSRPYISLRFGLELLKPPVLESTANDGTSDLYSVTSSTLGYVPKLSLDFNIYRTNSNRSFISASIGSASVTLKNDYILTSAGQTAFPSVIDHGTESKGSSTSYSASLGYEGLMTDTTTYLVEFGYRLLKIDNLKYTKDVATFAGNKTSGEDVPTSDGSQRSLDFSGGFISIGFRFYM